MCKIYIYAKVTNFFSLLSSRGLTGNSTTMQNSLVQRGVSISTRFVKAVTFNFLADIFLLVPTSLVWTSLGCLVPYLNQV